MIDLNDFSFKKPLTECSELTSKFAPKKESGLVLVDSFRRLSLSEESFRFSKRADMVEDCGTFLEFAHCIQNDGLVSDKGKLHNANFCRDRLCPMCSWRRSYKIFAQVSQIMQLIKGQYAFVFLTLTIPNVSSSKLSSSIDDLNYGWKMLSKYKRVKRVIKGYFKALEITRNNATGMYHPHFHVVLAVPKRYFKTDLYIDRNEWLEIWRACMKDDSITQLDIRRAINKKAGEVASNDLSSAVAEIAKYAVKSSEYLYPNDNDKTDEIVKTFADVLHGRRLTTFDRNGAFGQARKKLQLDDAEDGDLIHVDGQVIDPSIAYLITRYSWSTGCYKMSTSYIKSPNDK